MTLEKAYKKLLIQEPFYGLYLMNVPREITPKAQTLRVIRDGIFVKLQINQEFWDTLSDTEQIACLKHEASHIILKHFTLYNDLDNRQAANIAMDAEINLYISGLPQGCVDSYTWVAIDPNFITHQGTRYNYKWLLNQGGGGGEGWEPVEGDPNRQGNHDGWETFKDLTEAERELIESQCDNVTKNVAESCKNRGIIPGEFSSLIDELLKPKSAVFNWKAYLRKILGHAESWNTKASKLRPNKRYDKSPGRKHLKKSKILIGVDTSGSVSNEELADFFSEINHVHKAGAKVMIAQFDTKITSLKEYNGNFDGKITGRGGTDQKEVVDLFNNDTTYDEYVLFTDGWLGYYPTRNSRGIVIISSEGRLPDDAPVGCFKEVIKIPNNPCK